MNIIITGTGFSFPDGTGATARVMAFARGLVHNGATVHVFLPKPSENVSTGNRNPNLKGVYEGIPFEYTCGQRLAARTRFGALLLYLKGLRRTFRSVRRIHRETPVDAILLWDAEIQLNFPVFKILAKSIDAVLISEQSEYPFVYFRNTVMVRMKRLFSERVIFKFFDGAIVISKYLHDYFAAHVRKSAGILQVPILVEPVFYEQTIAPVGNAERKIVYCGNLEHNGEVAGLLHAFGQIAGEFPEWGLEVIGPLPQQRDAVALLGMTEQLGLTNRVTFTGAIARAAIPARLAAGDIMALPRASGTFSTAGFPTKLGEYLATGKAVVVTDTGDIADYLQNGVNAFLVPPDDTMAFAQALRHVMSHPDEAREVGRRGREVAASQFNSNLHGARIMEFIQTLRKPGVSMKGAL